MFEALKWPMHSEYYFPEGQHLPPPMALHKGLYNATLSQVSGTVLGWVSVPQVSLKAGVFKDQRQGSEKAVSMPQSPSDKGPEHTNGQH